MVRITQHLIRKRAEHNEGEIFSLEELSLHQQNIEKIEYLDKWCKNLKILYLQSNLISKIENVGKLKQLNYLNLALNNIERIENLDGCEFLNKLDLTVNFIGELTSVENLIDNYHLKDMYLTGNPCTDYDGYRDYVIATLPQLKTLDGEEIKKSDRIKALQNYKQIKSKILECQNKYFEQRKKQKEEYNKRKSEWDSMGENRDEEFWSEKTEYTPESRIETHKFQEEVKRKQDEDRLKTMQDPAYLEATKNRERRFFSDDGKPFSFNDPKVDYEYNGDDDKYIILNVHVFKFMDSSLIDLDVQTNYIRVTLKGKSLQLALTEEVKPGTCQAKRSQTTGHLMIQVEKVNQIVRQTNNNNDEKAELIDKKLTASSSKIAVVGKHSTSYLEVDESLNKNKIDLSKIVEEVKQRPTPQIFQKAKEKIVERENSTEFIDDSDVPPLI